MDWEPANIIQPAPQPSNIIIMQVASLGILCIQEIRHVPGFLTGAILVAGGWW